MSEPIYKCKCGCSVFSIRYRVTGIWQATLDFSGERIEREADGDSIRNYSNQKRMRCCECGKFHKIPEGAKGVL